MIADEVICGFGRTGSMWGSQTFGIKPDILSCAKALSSSYLPIAAVMINEKVYSGIRDNSGKLGTFGHGFTYSGHPVSAAVALETLKIYEERDIVGMVRRVAPAFQKRLRSFADHPMVGEVRGTGLIGAIELVRNKETREAFDPKLAVGLKTANFCQQNGLITRAMMDSIGFCPPLVITEAQIDQLFDRFGRSLDEVHGWASQEGLLA
jgi:4-aminobutyrate--pyruvate transaminase